MKPAVFLRLIRANQWVKNGFIFMPLVFSGKLFNAADYMSAIFVFAIFCLLSSSVYILNDLNGLRNDRLHPKKKERPLANGAVGKIPAAALLIILLTLSMVLAYRAGRGVFIVALLYLVTHIAYNAALKETVILDVLCIAFGFELRVWAGAVVLNILPSIWLQLCVLLLALLLSFVKRKDEKRLLDDKAISHRGVLAHYSVHFLDQMITISSTLCIISYTLYALSGDIAGKRSHQYLAYTVPFVLYGIFRYLYLVDAKKMGGDPEEIFTSDIPFIFNMALWLSSTICALYLCR